MSNQKPGILWVYFEETKLGMQSRHTLNSTYNEVTFNEKLPITKENLCTKYTPFTYKYVILNEKPPITKQNLCIFFFIIGTVECRYKRFYSPEIDITWTLISVVDEYFPILNGKVTRTQFSLRQAGATTIHAGQCSTFQQVCLDMDVSNSTGYQKHQIMQKYIFNMHIMLQQCM